MTLEWTKSGVDLLLDVSEGRGRRAGLEAALREAVRDGRLAPGTRLPPTRVLAGELGMSRGTVTAAYRQLVAEGYLTARSGAGTTVSELPAGSGGRTGRRDRSEHDPAPPRDRPRHNLFPGRPDVSAFPVDAWLRAARRVLPRTSTESFALGDPRGDLGLRVALAEYLGRTRGVLADPETILVTTGIMQGIGLLARVLHDAGCTTIAMEDPSLPMHREVVRRAGPAVCPLPVDEHGASGQVATDAGALVVTPSHQAGLGVVLSPHRRRDLLDWASATGGLIIEDDYDGEFRYDRQPIGALQGIAPEHVGYLGTASKTLAPGIRIGWMVVPPRLVQPVTEAKYYADAQNDVIGQLVLAELIRDHDYDRHIRAQRLRYRRRRDQLLRRLEKEVPEVRVRGAAAGVQLLIELPVNGPTEERVQAAATARGLALATMGQGWQRPAPHRPAGVVVGYATPPDHAWSGALDALVATLRECLDTGG